ncbi:Fc.00g061950.m01.CDS01 [Cosmosporella sp. VM-42]
MPATPRKPPADQQAQTPASQKKRLDKGLWKDGQWWCNCEPRKKATLRETKKGRNQGKLFWTCNVYPYCDFFLWRDQAKAREAGPASPTEETAESSRSKAPAFTQRPLTAFGYQVTPGRRLSDVATAGSGVAADATDLTDSDEELEFQPSSTLAEMGTPCPPSSKRKRDAFEEDTEFSDLDSDEERQLAAIADKSAEKIRAAKAPITPSNTRTHDVVNGLPTPSVARTLFPGSDAKRQKQVTFEDTPSSATLSATVTPSTVRSQAPPSSSPPDTSYDVTDEVMTLLRGQNIEPDVLTSVQSVLTTSARKAKGIAMGRESARASLKARDDRIAALQERIVALENKERMHHSRVTNIKANLMKMYEDN